MRSHRRALRPVLAAALLLLPAGVAAQEVGGWRAVPVFGAYTYDNATPFETSAFVGGELHHPIGRFLSVGGMVTFARPRVDGSYFPPALFQVSADTLILFDVGQQVSQVSYAALLSAGTWLGRAQIYAQAGVGGYTFFIDSQSGDQLRRAGGETSVTNLLVPVGAGVTYMLGDRAGIRLDVKDEIFTSFDRDAFNVVAADFRNVCGVEHQQNVSICFPERNPSPPEAKSTNHNFRFSVGFEFLPGGR